MQLSSNSNEALRLLIRSHPTYAGQYRQAKVHLRDRLEALAQATFDLQRQQQFLELKRLEIEELEQNMLSEERVQIRKMRVQVNLLEIDCRQIEGAIAASQELLADARREAQVCQQEMLRIQSQSGLNFEEMPEPEFQEHMRINTRAQQARWLAAGVLAPQIGIPSERLEELLSLPPEILKEQMSMMRSLVDGFVAIANPNPQLLQGGTDGRN